MERLIEESGNPMSMAQKFCGECGAPIGDGIRFCGECGVAIVNFQNSGQKPIDEKVAPKPPPKPRQRSTVPPEQPQTRAEPHQRSASKDKSNHSPKKSSVRWPVSTWGKLVWLQYGAIAAVVIVVLLGGVNLPGMIVIIALAAYIFFIKRKKASPNSPPDQTSGNSSE